jgi:type VI secretion system protein ImpG
MDPELPEYYQDELLYIRELFQEFAQQHPKIARRLGAQAGEVGDLYVERLLQSFALSAARSQMRIDRMTDALTQRLLQCIHPNYVTPLPSMAVARFYPDHEAAHSAQGQVLPRSTKLTSRKAEEGCTACEFRTSQDVTLWPLRISLARSTGIAPDVPSLHRYVQDPAQVRGALRLRLATINGTPIANLLGLNRLPIYLCGDERTASHLFELVHTSVLGIVMGVPGEFETGELYGAKLPGMTQMGVDYEGLEPDESLLRPVLPKLHGHNLVHEYFACPARFWFFALTGLAAGLTKIRGPEVEIVLLLAREVATLDQKVDASQFALFCTPVINLFALRTEKFDIDPGAREHRLVPHVTAPDDYEIHSVNHALGQVDEESGETPFQPLDVAIPNDERGGERYFALRRELDGGTHSVRRFGTRQPFTRTHVWLSLLGHDRELDGSGMRHLTLDAWLTNGDLPCVTPRDGVTDLLVKDAKAVASVGYVRAPTSPRAPLARGDAAWVLISQLRLDCSVFDSNAKLLSGEMLRTLLRPYVAAGEPIMQRQLDSLIGARAQPLNVMHRDAHGPRFGRGIEVTLTFDEETFGDGSPFTLALALERYVARHVSTHSFTRTVLCTKQRGPVFTWPTRNGTREVI